MKTKRSLAKKSTLITNSRWAAYATAGAATALAASPSLEAAIHYSGLLERKFPRHEDTIKTFQLDQPGDLFRFRHHYGNVADAHISGVFRASFRQPALLDTYYLSKLSFGQNISSGRFDEDVYYYPLLAAGSSRGRWRAPGTGFVGFRFYGNQGFQYGWIRVRMGGSKKDNGFKLMDYAYADAGEPIRAGQISRDGQGPDLGSLGLLAAGAAGVIAWRKSRSRRAA